MRVLIIEDEHRIANSIKKGLEQERFAVDVAYNGLDGFDLASTESYDVIILDIMLPDKDGFTICKELREKNVQVPILMLTAKGQLQDKVSGLNYGADDYLTKPFAFEELLARLHALMRRPQPVQKSILHAGNLTIDTTLFSVERDGRQIQLSAKEFSLLEYLIRHTNTILTKEQIISHVWDYDADILPNTIEVYIRNLRKKIDNPFPASQPLIHTVRGFGYKIST